LVTPDLTTSTFDAKRATLYVVNSTFELASLLNAIRIMRKFRLGISITFALLLVSYVYTIKKTFVQISSVSLTPNEVNLKPLGEGTFVFITLYLYSEEKAILTQLRNKEIIEKMERTSEPVFISSS
jgi:hypothetical protein